MATASTARERPIIFAEAESVRAILAGRKTQTRRRLIWEPRAPGLNLGFSGLEAGHYMTGVPDSGWVLRSRRGDGIWEDRTYPTHCPWGRPGGRLWVRERLRVTGEGLEYAADGEEIPLARDARAAALWNRYAHEGGPDLHPTTVPSILMPRWASRIRLELQGVRIERLQDISEADIVAEGITPDWPEGEFNGPRPFAEAFAYVWDRLNARRGCGWATNPWVWVLTFRRIDG